MKRTSWRAAPAPRSRALLSSGARAPHSQDEGRARPVPILKATPSSGDSPGVRPSQHATADTASARRRPRWLRPLAIIPAVLAAAALAGCFSIVGQATVQEGDIGDEIVTTDMCLSAGPAGCGGGLTETVDGDIQYLIGYLMPTWALEPATIQWNGGIGDQTLTRNVAYESILQGFAPAPLGLHWIGYASARRPAPPTEADVRMQATARIGIPETAPGTLQLATVTGWRTVRDASPGKSALPIDRAFNCAETTDSAPTTTCILSGEPVQSTSPGQTPIANDVPINTMSLSPPTATANVRAGSTVVMRFPLATNYSGAGNDTIPMKVTSTLKGAKFEFPPNVILGGSLLPAEVTVTAPLIAETGDYTVTLATANGLRRATGNLRVTGIRSLIGPTTSPTVKTIKESAALLRKYLRTAKSSEIRRGNTFDLPVTLPSAGALSGTLNAKGAKKTVLSKGKSTSKIPGEATLHLAPTSNALRTLRAGKPLKGKLTLVFRPRTGKAQTTALTVSLK